MLRLANFMLFFLMMSELMQAQTLKALQDKATKVYFIGEDEKEYEKLVKNYNSLLFTVCENKMEKAYDSWSLLLKDIDDYASKQNFDLKGVKLWLNVFWDKDGSIDFIVFYPKPNSKNINYDQLKIILIDFGKSYQSPLKYTSTFSHYGSASFPLFNKSISGSEK
ncbi:MAG: hypothetical protein IPK35_08730 [Saprospiraceae bacterium]|jgi:hypothetical protein|nr:hypothetical protein [Saprospiraceae bacterium]